MNLTYKELTSLPIKEAISYLARVYYKNNTSFKLMNNNTIFKPVQIESTSFLENISNTSLYSLKFNYSKISCHKNFDFSLDNIDRGTLNIIVIILALFLLLNFFLILFPKLKYGTSTIRSNKISKKCSNTDG